MDSSREALIECGAHESNLSPPPSLVTNSRPAGPATWAGQHSIISASQMEVAPQHVYSKDKSWRMDGSFLEIRYLFPISTLW